MLIKGTNKTELQSKLNKYFKEDFVDSHEIAKILNEFIKGGDKLYPLNVVKKTKYRILLTTGAGNLVKGGADIWVNNFLKLVWPNLPDKKSWRLLIDSKRPNNFDPYSLPKGLHYHFHFDDVEKTNEWLSECVEIHSLHSHYHKRDHIWHWEDKFKTCFVHAYPKEMDDTINAIPELKRLQYNTNVDSKFCSEYYLTFKKRIWIGNNKTDFTKDFPTYTYNIPNYYEFTNNLPLTTHIDNGKIGFASRVESRKCIHWLNEMKGYALTSQWDVKNLKDTTSYSLPGIEIFQWDEKIHHHFMMKNWGIFHGAYFKEPFGYSIFQAVDYGKLPIIHKDWAPEVDYDYRVSTMNEFKKMHKKILIDSHSKRLKNFNNLKTYMKQFDNKTSWADKVRSIILDN